MLYEVNFSLARDFSVSQYLLFPKAVAHWLPGERLLTAIYGRSRRLIYVNSQS
jgi:hypothetical protein